MLNELVESVFKQLSNEQVVNYNNTSVSTREAKQQDSNNELSPKRRVNKDLVESRLNSSNRNLIGWYGEKFVYGQLLKNNRELLDSLGIIEEIHESDIELKGVNDCLIKMEIETSFGLSGYFKITRNELRDMASGGNIVS